MFFTFFFLYCFFLFFTYDLSLEGGVFSSDTKAKGVLINEKGACL